MIEYSRISRILSIKKVNYGGYLIVFSREFLVWLHQHLGTQRKKGKCLSGFMLGSLPMSKSILIQPGHTQHVQLFYPKRPVLARPGTKERSTPSSLQSSSRLAHVNHVDVIAIYVLQNSSCLDSRTYLLTFCLEWHPGPIAILDLEGATVLIYFKLAGNQGPLKGIMGR